MMKSHRFLLAISFACLLPCYVFSEVPVVDDSENFVMLEEEQNALEQPVVRDPGYSHDHDEETPLVHDNFTSHDQHDNAILLDKIQNLQQEVQELRGLLEVQAHDLKLLQQQQLAFYKDLDTLLSGAPTQTTQHDSEIKPSIDTQQPEKTTTTLSSVRQPNPISHTTRANPAEEQISYLAAYELVKNKQYDEAMSAMQTFINQYPQSGYAANAQYWLGELYMIKKNYSQAIEHFESVLQQYPSSSKSSASLLKIGYALAESGKKNEAKQRLQQVVKNYPDTNTAQLASAKLASLDT